MNDVATIINLKPSTEGAVLDFDEQQLHDDIMFIQHYSGNLTSAMQELISSRQLLGAANRLCPDSLHRFMGFPRFGQLRQLAHEGAHPILRPDFQPNAGVQVEPLRPQFFKLKPAIRHQLAKLQREHKGFILPKKLVHGWEFLHLNPSHVVLKVGDSKGRVCMDPRASGLNDGTDLEAIYEDVGILSLPSVRDVASNAVAAISRGDNLIAKYDISSAFTQFKLSWKAAALQAIDLDDLIFIPLVGMFGWTASPAYYDLISKAVDWAHCGGIPVSILDDMARDQNKVPVLRSPEWISPSRLQKRSITYVDDTALFCNSATAGMDAQDFEVIACCLLGPNAINPKKTEGPAPCMEVIGWAINMDLGIIGPSNKGICKMLYYVFRLLRPPIRSCLVKHLGSDVGILRHYSTVMPILYGTLSQLQRQLAAARHSVKLPSRINLSAASLGELSMWRIMLAAGLAKRDIWTCPLAFIQRNSGPTELHMVTDAALLHGGGYLLTGVSFGHWLWSPEEHQFFSNFEGHINVLELEVLVLAVVANLKHLKDRYLHVQIDNTSALSWANALQAKSPAAQPWARLLLLACVSYNIHLSVTHIPGVDNVVADDLSRNVQTTLSRLAQQDLSCPPILEPAVRLALSQTTSGHGGLWEQWSQAHDVLISQDVPPSISSVLSTISTLGSNSTR